MAADIEVVTQTLIDEVFVAAGLPRDGAARRHLGGIADPPARRLATLMVEFDRRTENDGIREGCRYLLPSFVSRVEYIGAEHVPGTGPVLVCTNHPGAYDGFAMVAGLPRDDVRVLTSDIPFFRALPHVSEHLIQTDTDPYRRLAAVRAAIRHLQGGGLVHTFARGFLEPDPLSAPGAVQDAIASLEEWSPSLELILRKAPETRVVVAMAGGVVSPRWLRSPLVRYRKAPHERRKLAEFMQIIYQLLRLGRLLMTPRVAYGTALSPAELLPDQPGALRRIIESATAVLTAQFTEQQALPLPAAPAVA
jgi:hypothetical protein